MTICNYGLIRFLPLIERDEFVNIGVAVCCEERKFLASRMIDDPSRIVSFFGGRVPEAKRLYLASAFSLQDEVDRLALLAGAGGSGNHMQLFKNLTMPRENLLRFSEIRTASAEDPAVFLEKAYHSYVLT